MCLITTSLNVMMYLGSWCSTTLIESISDQQSHQDTSSENHKCFHAFFMSIDLAGAEIFHPVVQEDESDDHQE